MFFLLQFGAGTIRLPFFLPHVLAHVILFYNVGGPEISMSIYGALVILVYVLKIFFPGTPGFQGNYPETDTPFEAGYKTVRTSKFGNEVQVFYPVSRRFKQQAPKINPYWLPHDYKSLNALLMLASKFVKIGSWIPNIVFNYLRYVRMDVYLDGDFAPEFKNKKIIPIFFSHGLTATGNFYSRI
jgi:hypothetical protein